MDDTIYLAKNSWKQGHYPSPPEINRRIFDQFEESLDRPEIIVLMGARQTGKTTLLLEMARRALVTGRVAPEHLHYLDLDTMRCEDVLSSNRSLIDFLGLEPGQTDGPRRFLFIDEIQRLENPGLFLKSVYDLGLPIKIAVTGSSTLEIRSRVRESLAGRSLRFHLWPLSPTETGNISVEKLDGYLRWGGFPAVHLERTDAPRQTLLANLLASYLDRDISDFLRIDNIGGFNSFMRLLALQTGQLVNLNEMANTLAVGRDTLHRHLNYLENTFMVRILRPFVGNRRGEITKMPKVYFADPGIRNLLAGRLTSSLTPADRGPLLENLVETLLRLDPLTEELFFWRTNNGAEVDFVWRAGGELYAVEVKAAALSRPAFSRAMGSFLKNYRPRRAAVVNMGFCGEIERENTPVLFLTPDRLLSIRDR